MKPHQGDFFNRIPGFIWATAVLILILVGGWFFNQQKKEHIRELQGRERLLVALQAEMQSKVLANGQVELEKLTIQAKLSELEKQKLTDTQKDLVEFIKRKDSESRLMAAALVKYEVAAKNIPANQPVKIKSDTTITFSHLSDSIAFEATVSDVRPGVKPSMVLDRLSLPNTAQIAFQWGDKKSGYPVTFSVTNTNPLFKVNNIESYAIPELVKTEIRPTFIEKIGRGVQKNKGPFVIGLGVGVIGTSFLLLSR